MENQNKKTLKDYPYFSESELREQIEKTRKEYNVVINTKYSEDSYVDGKWIPFNLERKYIDFLIKQKRYSEAELILKKMRLSYFSPDFQNFIESYEYRLESILHLDKEIKDQIQEAKKEFNKHTITLVTIIVSLVTIFGVANNTLYARNFKEGIITFFAISTPILIVSVLALFLFNKKKKIDSWHEGGKTVAENCQMLCKECNRRKSGI